ncbi:MAG: hypothetical protein MUP90_00575 [Gammaproteobacteria bacterium]|nr:hypothetical protein [Gammaproteobacteria bacterium]
MAMARLSVLSGDNPQAILLANKGYAIAQTPEGRRRINFYNGYRYGYAGLLCGANDLANAEIEFRRILSEQNGTTLAFLVNGWPPCAEKMAGTDNYMRLDKEFGHLAQGE